MLIPQFLAWADEASAEERADAAFSLAGAYLYADLDPFIHGEAERALTILLDDPSALVRRALAEAFASSLDVPRHLVVALASDQSDIAALVLERSPLLDDADLIDAVALGDTIAQGAVARRPSLSVAVAGALAEVGSADAALALCANRGADLSRFVIERLIARFGTDGRIREMIGSRGDLAAEIRHALVMATATALARFVTQCHWMSPERADRLVQDSGDRATLAIAACAPGGPGVAGGSGAAGWSADVDGAADHRTFAAYLRAAGYLTPALLLRALLSRNVALFEAALSELSGRNEARVAGLLRSPGGLGFAALYKSTGLPPTLLPVFRAALGACREALRPTEMPIPGRLDRGVVTRVIRACQSLPRDEYGRLGALLRRFDVEAARDEVRLFKPAEPEPRLGSGARLLIEHAPAVELALPVAA